MNKGIELVHHYGKRARDLALENARLEQELAAERAAIEAADLLIRTDASLPAPPTRLP